MEQKHANETLQWAIIDQEEEEQVHEELTLKGRQTRKQLQDDVISNVTLSSSSPTIVNGVTGHANDVSLNSGQEELVTEKEGHVEEMGEIKGADVSHCNEEKSDDDVAVGVGVVAECSETSSNGEAVMSDNTDASQHNNRVYFDKQDGKWKCHHCTWTMQFDTNSTWTTPIWDLEQNSDSLMNIKAMIKHGSCCISETKGSEASNISYEVENGDGKRSALPRDNGVQEFHIQVENQSIQKRECNGVNNHDMKTMGDTVPFNSKVSPLRDSTGITTNDVNVFDAETSTKADPDLIEEIDQQLKEYDLENVLAKQETHDLICPNCNSCITKRVILRKRKRSPRNLENKPKRDKLDTLVSSESVGTLIYETNQGDRANSTSDGGHLEQQPSVDNNPVQEQEVFRCLECFSIFIPRGNRFKLFWNSSSAHELETSQITSAIPSSNMESSSNMTISHAQNSSSVAGSNGNWFLSLFTSNKGKPSNEQGKGSSENAKTGPAEQKNSSSFASNAMNSPENGHLDNPVTGTSNIENRIAMPDVKPEHEGLNGNLVPLMGEEKNGLADIKNTADHFKANVANLPTKNFTSNIVTNQERDLPATATVSKALTNPGELARDATQKPGEREPDFLVQPHEGSTVPEKSLKDINKTPENFQNAYSSLIKQAQVANDAATGMISSGLRAKTSSAEVDLRLTEKVEKITEGQIKPAVSSGNTGDDVIVDVEEDNIKLSASQIGVTDPNNGSILRDTVIQVSVGEQPRAEIGESRGWEVLKSIVYGGLIESITSLGIVSSAVGSGAAPLNIIALALANMIGGLFVIGHNLLELRDDKSGDDVRQTNTQENRYQEQLGRHENFILHAVVAILSFLIFGSVPIVVYGFLIRKNYQTELKLAAVATASMICIILLAAGKVYTKRPPKSYSKTIFYYVTMSLAASGVSYIVGGLIMDFIEKLSNSQSGFAITMPRSGLGTMDAALRSY